MARFRATIKGSRGEASRLGHRELTARVHGWDVGVTVYAVDDGKGNDEIVVHVNGGSHGGFGPVFVCSVRLDKNGVPTAYVTQEARPTMDRLELPGRCRVALEE